MLEDYSMLHTRLFPNLLLVVLVALLTACAPRPVIDYNPARNFQALHSFAWIGADAQIAKDPVIYNALTEQRVREAVDSELVGRGYKRATEKDADVLVTWHLTVKQKVQGNSVGLGVGMFNAPFGLGGEVVMTQYEEGELFIDMLDPKTRELIWRGSLRYPLSAGESPEQRAGDIWQKVSTILSRFPPQ